MPVQTRRWERGTHAARSTPRCGQRLSYVARVCGGCAHPLRVWKVRDVTGLAWPVAAVAVCMAPLGMAVWLLKAFDCAHRLLSLPVYAAVLAWLMAAC